MIFFIAYKITPMFSASITLTWQNDQFTYLLTNPDSEDLELIRYKPVFFGNLLFQYQNIANKGIGFGVYNLFDTPMFFFIH